MFVSSLFHSLHYSPPRISCYLYIILRCFFFLFLFLVTGSTPPRYWSLVFFSFHISYPPTPSEERDIVFFFPSLCLHGQAFKHGCQIAIVPFLSGCYCAEEVLISYSVPSGNGGRPWWSRTLLIVGLYGSISFDFWWIHSIIHIIICINFPFSCHSCSPSQKSEFSPISVTFTKCVMRRPSQPIKHSLFLPQSQLLE